VNEELPRLARRTNSLDLSDSETEDQHTLMVRFNEIHLAVLPLFRSSAVVVNVAKVVIAALQHISII